MKGPATGRVVGAILEGLINLCCCPQICDSTIHQPQALFPPLDYNDRYLKNKVIHIT